MPAEPSSRVRPEAGKISAVFVIDRSRLLRPMMEAWVGAGHEVAALVTMVRRERPKRSRLALRLRRPFGLLPFWQDLESRDIPLFELRWNADWASLIPRLGALRADVLVCFGFPRKIPADVLALFPHGGVNLHPALLPQYRGPFPIHRMIEDEAQALHGGVTLHRMNAGMDEGDILAQLRFRAEDWASLGAFQVAVSSALAQLAVEAVPLAVSGALRGRRQEDGPFIWASAARSPLLVSPAWTSDYVGRICMFLSRRPGVAVEVDGIEIGLVAPLRRIGPATGRPAAVGHGSASFDLADGRVAVPVRSKWTERAARFRARLVRLSRRPPVFSISYFDGP